MRHEYKSAPNYTNACIAMFGVNITWILFAIWAFWGLLIAAITGWCVNRVINWIAARRAA